MAHVNIPGVRRQADDFSPPYVMYTSTRPASDIYAISLIGVQSAAEEDASSKVEEIHAMLRADAPGKPLHVERSWNVDPQGYRNDILMPYWADDHAMKLFMAREDVVAWRNTPCHGPIGWWRESMYGPMSSVDSTYTMSDTSHGISRYAPITPMQFHGYMGSMRDRVPDFLSGKADGAEGQIVRRTDQPDSRGRHLTITGLPHNLCFIRGPMGSSRAPAEEKQAFIEEIVPVFKDAANYLRDDPTGSNCISLRVAETIPTDFDSGVEGEIFGWFLTLQDLERFTEHHPKHLAILSRIGQFAARFNFQLRQNGGHEVLVVPQGQVECEYSNCHPETGFLPFFPAEEVRPLDRIDVTAS